MSKVKFQISSAALVAILVALDLALAMSVGAQNGTVRLSLSKAWGYSMGGQIQGLFNMSVAAPVDATAVRFELDGQEISTITRPPFSMQFNTGQYPPGWHRLSATVQTPGGPITSNIINAEFVSAEQSGQVVQRIIVPILAIVGLVTLLGIGGQFLLSGRQAARPDSSAPRNYGIAGGAICPRCARPFARHVLGLNMLVGKLERCPYCGKWSIVPAASPAALAAAEAAELAAAQPDVPAPSPEERLRRQIEDSKYHTD